ncbi:hypothetical protein ATJ97_2161 [Georgenia soli]|uniref:Uncharacterized protein n=1 Tax=Georgenia soli TaxID=638953 RepID=A0A2A9EN40_9MICO|nr:hypothetical protein [Georgenia soli]PFG39650.1 hypothetical protein ATJ97_2161 [Georgenia soli]
MKVLPMLAAASIALTGLSACSAEAEPAATAAPTAAAPAPETSEPVAEETAEKPLASGDTITAEQVVGLAEGFRAYTMIDGSQVAIADAEELPQVVIDDVVAGGNQVTGGALTAESSQAFIAYTEGKVEETGRKIVAVYPATGHRTPEDAEAGKVTSYWGTYADMQTFFDTMDEAKAVADAYVATQEPLTRVTIVFG